MSFTNKMNMNICGMLAASTMLLTACGGGGSNAAPAATTAKVLHFADIKAVLNLPSTTGSTAGGTGCLAAACHSPGSASLTNYGDIDRNGDGVVDAADDTLYYNAVMARVSTATPASSALLQKPSLTVGHVGNKRAGFDTSLAIGSAGRASYDLFLAWIVAGAAY